MDAIVNILLCEDGDVELGARTSKHIFVFAFDPLSLTLSYLPCIDSYCHIIHKCLVCLCASLMLNQESFTLYLNFYLEEFKGDSPKPFTGNSATLFGYTRCVAISF